MLEQKRFQQAAIEFQKVFEVYPDSDLVDEAYYHMGEALALLENYDEAIATLTQLIRQFPQSPYADEAIFLSGESFLRVQGYENAIQTLEKLEADYPESPLCAKAQMFIGRAYYLQRDYANGFEAYRKVINTYKDPTFGQEALFQLAKVNAEILKQSDTARSLIMEFLQEFPEHKQGAAARAILARL